MTNKPTALLSIPTVHIYAIRSYYVLCYLLLLVLALAVYVSIFVFNSSGRKNIKLINIVIKRNQQSSGMLFKEPYKMWQSCPKLDDAIRRYILEI